MTPEEIRKFDAEEKSRLQRELDDTRRRLVKAERTIRGVSVHLRKRHEDTTARATALLSAAIDTTDEEHRQALQDAAAALTTEAAAYQLARDLLALFEVKPHPFQED